MSSSYSFVPSLPEIQEYLESGIQSGEKIQGLTTKEEQLWCEYYCEKYYRNRGDIVELGPWLGSLTRSMQNGLTRNEFYIKSPPLDRFIAMIISLGFLGAKIR